MLHYLGQNFTPFWALRYVAHTFVQYITWKSHPFDKIHIAVIAFHKTPPPLLQSAKCIFDHCPGPADFLTESLLFIQSASICKRLHQCHKVVFPTPKRCSTLLYGEFVASFHRAMEICFQRWTQRWNTVSCLFITGLSLLQRNWKVSADMQNWSIHWVSVNCGTQWSHYSVDWHSVQKVVARLRLCSM